MHDPELVVLHLQHVDVYDPKDSRSRFKHKKPAVYGVDVITIATRRWVFTWHASQSQEKDRFAFPGPYKAANAARDTAQHFDNAKWTLLPAILDLLVHPKVKLAGFGLRGQITRLKRTFLKSNELTSCKPKKTMELRKYLTEKV